VTIILASALDRVSPFQRQMSNKSFEFIETWKFLFGKKTCLFEKKIFYKTVQVKKKSFLNPSFNVLKLGWTFCKRNSDSTLAYKERQCNLLTLISQENLFDLVFIFIFLLFLVFFVRMWESHKRFVKTWIRFTNPWIRTVLWPRILTPKRFDSYPAIRILDSYRIVDHKSWL
jgi:hypothetical protein